MYLILREGLRVYPEEDLRGFHLAKGTHIIFHAD